jgi:DNA (cytosine-5)-methyltransferase 1
MSDCLIHPNTPDKWIASMQDSLVKTLALLESRQVYLRELDQVFTEKSCVLLASLSQDKSFWKTCQQSFLTDSEPYSQTWPRWGMTQGGFAYAHPMSERRITETDGSHYVPTPTVTSGAQVAWNKTPRQTGGTTLAGYVKYWPTPQASQRGDCPSERNRNTPGLVSAVKMWPTPNASDNRDRWNMSNPSVQRRIEIGKQIGLSTAVKETSDGGTLNPTWVEWLMALPIGFTASKDSETRKSRSKPQLHGDYLGDSNA